MSLRCFILYSVSCATRSKCTYTSTCLELDAHRELLWTDLSTKGFLRPSPSLAPTPLRLYVLHYRLVSTRNLPSKASTGKQQQYILLFNNTQNQHLKCAPLVVNTSIPRLGWTNPSQGPPGRSGGVWTWVHMSGEACLPAEQAAAAAAATPDYNAMRT